MLERNKVLKRNATRSAESRAPTDVGFESAERALEREQADADVHTPEWDFASRITTARGALERGVPAEVVRKAFGEQIFAAASAQRTERELIHAAT
jgi:hypothetical protein